MTAYCSIGTLRSSLSLMSLGTARLRSTSHTTLRMSISRNIMLTCTSQSLTTFWACLRTRWYCLTRLRSDRTCTLLQKSCMKGRRTSSTLTGQSMLASVKKSVQDLRKAMGTCCWHRQQHLRLESTSSGWQTLCSWQAQRHLLGRFSPLAAHCVCMSQKTKLTSSMCHGTSSTVSSTWRTGVEYIGRCMANLPMRYWSSQSEHLLEMNKKTGTAYAVPVLFQLIKLVA